MNYLGDFPTGATVYVPFHTFNAAGASVTLTGLATTDVEIYKNGGTTQRASEAGYTLLDTDGIDFDGVTGIHGFSIDTSDNTDAGFFAAGNEYMVVVASVTVDSQTVNFVAATFSIERAGGALALLKNATYGLSAIETLVDDLETRLTAARAGYLDNINNAALSTTAAQTGDAYARLGAPAGASVSADVAAIKSDTAAILTDTGTTLDTLIKDIPTVAEFEARTLAAADYVVVTDTIAGATVVGSVTGDTKQTADVATLIATVGAAGAGLTALPWNAAWDAEVQSEATDALNAYDPPTKAELDSAVANVSVDEIQASALADLFNTDSGATYSVAVAGSAVKEIADNAGGSALTESGIADAVWDEALSGHTASGSAGEALSAAGTAGDPWTTALPGAYGSGTAGNILGNRLVGTIASGTHNAQTGDAFARLGAPAGASVSADIADLPTVTEFNARTLVAANYFDPATDVVARVTLVDTTTTLTNMPAAAPSAADIKTALEADGGKLDHIWEMTEDDGGVRRLTANALEEAPTGTGSGLTAQQTRDAMKLAPTAGAPAAGSIDAHLDDLATALAAATTTLTVVSAVDGDVLTIYQAVSFSATVSGLSIPVAWTKVWFTVKRAHAELDADAIVQIVESNPGVGTDGLARLNGAAGTAGNGALTVSQAGGTVVIELVNENTDDLALATGLIWSLKALASSGATTLLAVGTLDVLGQATLAIS